MPEGLDGLDLSLSRDFDQLYSVQSPTVNWDSCQKEGMPRTLEANTHHQVDFSVECHATAFTEWKLVADSPTRVTLRVMYVLGGVRGFETVRAVGNDLPLGRSKGDHLDHVHGMIIGRFEEVTGRSVSRVSRMSLFRFAHSVLIVLTCT